MDASRPDLLDPASLAALGRLEVIARWVVDGFLTGLHRSPRKGFSVEFAEHRPYQPGDDLRYLDWKILARADRWVIKQFEEETNLRAMLLLDVSPSMAWSGSPNRLTKQAWSEASVAALSLLLLKQRDAVGFLRFDDEVRTVLPPRARTAQWRRVLAELGQPGTGTTSSFAAAVERAAALVTRPGLFVILSDLLVEPEEATRAVRTLRAVGHDIVILHVMDPAERDLEEAGDAKFTDPESGDALAARGSDVRDAYRETVETVIGEWRERFAGAGAFYDVVSTDAPFGTALRRAFAVRQSLP
ncbi:MAG: DUF58 domain-containing protein [Gemmatimonadetes bacterium]|nr:DUF58 domain-containing protein [Gemmatimonadota bacterium]